MDHLIDTAWELYNQSQSHPCLVQPSCPILFFGDLTAYQSSALKVVTIAWNPSGKEFPADDPFQRFPGTSRLFPEILLGKGRTTYIESLNEYFQVTPYRSWFGWFEEVLIGMGTSYYEGALNTALHTDLCSPLATDPTWSGLGSEQAYFESGGIPLWHRLIDELAPDVLVFSIAKRFFDRVDIADSSKWKVLHTVTRVDPGKRPYRVYFQRSANNQLVVFGQAAQQPFATLNKQSRQEIGRAILTYAN